MIILMIHSKMINDLDSCINDIMRKAINADKKSDLTRILDSSEKGSLAIYNPS